MTNMLYQLETIKQKWKTSSPFPFGGEWKGSFLFLNIVKQLKQRPEDETGDGFVYVFVFPFPFKRK